MNRRKDERRGQKVLPKTALFGGFMAIVVAVSSGVSAQPSPPAAADGGAAPATGAAEAASVGDAGVLPNLAVGDGGAAQPAPSPAGNAMTAAQQRRKLYPPPPPP